LSEEKDAATRAQMEQPDFTDQSLDFGALKIGAGKAFADDSAPTAAAEGTAPVGKSWPSRVIRSNPE
jgi:hypothetical protein